MDETWTREAGVEAMSMWQVAERVGSYTQRVEEHGRRITEVETRLGTLEGRVDEAEPTLRRLVEIIDRSIPAFDFLTKLFPLKETLDRVLEREEEKERKETAQKNQLHQFQDTVLKWLGGLLATLAGVGAVELSKLPDQIRLAALGVAFCLVIAMTAILAVARYKRS